MQLQLESQFAKSDLLCKCGLLAHTSAAFLKNCCTEKLLIAYGSYSSKQYQFYKIILFTKYHSRENNLSHPAKGGSTPAFASQLAAIAPLPCPNLQLVSQNNQIANWTVSKNAIAAGKPICKI